MSVNHKVWNEILATSQENAQFLRVLKKTRATWIHDKDFSKIVGKMEKGKNLKKNEFARIHWFLWEKGH